MKPGRSAPSPVRRCWAGVASYRARPPIAGVVRGRTPRYPLAAAETRGDLLLPLPRAHGAARRTDLRTRAGRGPGQRRAARLDRGQPAQGHLGGACHHHPRGTGVEQRALRFRRRTGSPPPSSVRWRELGTDLASNVRETSLARWRYSWVTQGDPEPCLVAVEEPPLVFSGDAFGAPKVEGAALSGLAAADQPPRPSA